MRAKSNMMLAFSAFAGVIGCILRRIEYNTALNGGIGIAREWTGISVCLMLFSAAAAVISAFLGYKLKKSAVSDSIEPNDGVMAMSIIGAVLIAAGSVLYYFQVKDAFNIASIVFAVLGLFCAAGVWLTAVYAGKESGAAKVLSVAPAIFCCFWLVVIYKDNSGEPQIIKFVYKCLAAAAQTMAFYYISGYFYGGKNGGKMILSSCLAVYFSILVMAEISSVWEILITAGIVFSISDNLRRLVFNLTKIS